MLEAPLTQKRGFGAELRAGVLAEQDNLSLLMGLDMGNRLVEFTAPHTEIVVHGVGIGTGAGHTLDCPASFLDLFAVESSQRQLRCVERDSVGAMNC